jgi:predicted N-acetyltransferase YhbS
MYKIDLLKNHSDAIPSLAKMWHELLGSLWVPNISIEQVEAKFRTHLNDEKLPLAFVVLDDNVPIGMCSLRKNDGIRENLEPWLGSLIVSRAYQGQGIGKLLIESIKDKAKELGFHMLYLFTFDPTLPEYYRRQGWEDIGQDQFKSHDVTVMQIQL